MLVRLVPNELSEASERDGLSWTEIPIQEAGNHLRHLETGRSKYEIRFSSTSITILPSFGRCRLLSKVEIPASVERIPATIFKDCPSLNSVIFPPNGRLKILSGFSSCTSLTAVDIPASVTHIKMSAFSHCSSLRDVRFDPNSSLEQLDGFTHCSSLLKIEIPASIGFLDVSTFSGCTSLCEVTFAPSSRLREFRRFSFLTSVPRITIPASVHILVRNVFVNCDSLVELVFEGREAFARLYAIRNSVQVRRIEMQEDWFSIFEDLDSHDMGAWRLFWRRRTDQWSFLSSASYDCDLLDEPFFDFVRIPPWISVPCSRGVTVTSISDRLFCLCVARSVKIPGYIRTLGSCFRSMPDCVAEIEIPSSIEVIDGFLQVWGLEQMRFASGSRVCEIRGFYFCESLERVEFPESLQIIDGFHHCHSLQFVLFARDSRLEQLRGFHYCVSLREIVIPSSVSEVLGFHNCLRLERIVFSSPSALKGIFGFHGCASICGVELPRTLHWVYVFNN
jgi:hypothetical protein